MTWKIVKVSSLTLLIIIAIVMMLVNYGPFQNYLVQKSVHYLQNKLKTKVHVGKFRLHILNQLSLEDVYIEDLKGDTLAHIGHLNVRTSDWIFITDDKPIIKYLGIENGQFNLIRPHNDSIWNYQFIVDAFSNNQNDHKQPSNDAFEVDLVALQLKDVQFHQIDQWVGTDYEFGTDYMQIEGLNVSTQSKRIFVDQLKSDGTFIIYRDYVGGRPPRKRPANYVKPIDTTAFNPDDWRIAVHHSEFNNAFFKYHFKFHESTPGAFDHKHIVIESISLILDSVSNVQDTLYGKITHLSGKERSGFTINNISGLATVSPRLSELKQLDIETPHSHLKGYYAMHYERFPDFEYYTDRVTMRSSLFQSKVAIEDIAYFAPELKGIREQLTFSGQYDGTVNLFDAHKLVILDQYGNTLKTNLRVENLENYEEAPFSFTDLTLAFSGKGLQSWLPELSKAAPLHVASIQKGIFNGTINGTLNDFHTKGQLITNLGQLDIDGKMLQLLSNSQPIYNAHLTVHHFALGQFIPNYELGQIDGLVKIDGQGFSSNNHLINLDVFLNELGYKSYNYVNLELLGTLEPQKFNGTINIIDPNAKGNLNVNLNFTNQEPYLLVDGPIRQLNFKALGISKELLVGKGLVDVNFKGKNLDEFVGNTQLKQVELFLDTNRLEFDSLNIQTAVFDKNNKQLLVESNAFSAQIEGQYNLSHLIPSVQFYLYKYLPSYIRQPKLFAPEQNIQFKVATRNLSNSLLKIIPQIKGFDNSIVVGNLNTSQRDLAITASIPYGYFYDFTIQNALINGHGDLNHLQLNGDFVAFQYGDSLLNTALNFRSVLGNDSLQFEVETQSPNFYGTASIKGVAIAKNNFLDISLSPSQLFVNDIEWLIPAGSRIVFRSDYLSVDNFKLVSEKYGQLSINTQYESEKPILFVNIKDVETSLYANVLKQYIYQPKGSINGLVKIKDAMTNPVFEMDLSSKHMQMGNDTLGQLVVIGTYHANDNQLILDSKTGLFNQHQFIKLNGAFAFNSDKKMAGQLIFNETPLTWLTSYAQELVHDLNGHANGYVTISGTGKEPHFVGKIALKDAAATVNFTGVRYFVPNTIIEADHNKLNFGQTQLFDRYGNAALLSGHIAHDFFSKINLALHMSSDKIEAINLKSHENELFYGNCIAQVLFTINGPLNNINFNIRALPVEKSHLFLPYYDESGVSSASYISFKKPNIKEETYTKSVDKINVVLTAIVNPLLKTTIVLDPVSGDQINAIGEGSFTLEMAEGTDMRMFGGLNVEEGDYTFTFKQLAFVRTFNINAGSTITFSGPYASTQLNIKAEKETRVKLSDLLTQQERTPNVVEASEDQPQRLLVKLHMTGTLGNPNYDYKLELPDNRSIGTAAYNKFQRLQQDKSELLEQVASLLILGSFMPTESAWRNAALSTTANNVGNIFSSAASTQLTNFFAKLLNDDKLIINLNYDNYNRNTSSFQILNRNEVSVDIKKNLFNDRLIIGLGSSYDWGRNMSSNNRNFNVGGDFRLQYLLTEDGRIRLSAFSISSYDVLEDKNFARSGLGLNYRKSFNTLSELLRKKPKNKPIDTPNNTKIWIPNSSLPIQIHQWDSTTKALTYLAQYWHF